MPSRAGKRAAVHGKNHGQRRLVNHQRLERRGIRQVGDAFADLDAFDAGHGDDVAGGDAVRFVALEAAERVELGDARGGQLAVQLADANFGAARSVPLKTRPMAMRPRNSL